MKWRCIRFLALISTAPCACNEGRREPSIEWPGPADASFGGGPTAAMDAAGGVPAPDDAPGSFAGNSGSGAAIPTSGTSAMGTDSGAPPASGSALIDASVPANPERDAAVADAGWLVPDASKPPIAVEGGNVIDAGDAGLGDSLPQASLDLSQASADPGFFRWYGSPDGDGSLGVPVATGDFDGDGNVDLAMASFQANPLGRFGAGRVAVLFGDGGSSGALDLAQSNADVLMIQGAGPREGTGSQLAVGDVDGDGIQDLLICRQNFRASNPDRIGAGALSILLGGSELRALATEVGTLDLASPPSELRIATVLGAHELDRLGIWARTGDLTGDGIEDLAIGADQEDRADELDAGAVYVIRGGVHLAESATFDLGLAVKPLAGHLAKVIPPASAAGFHFGATVHVGDLDRNGRGELVAAAALVRSGASFLADGAAPGSAVSSAGAPPGGRAYVVWDDHFPADPWPEPYVVDLAAGAEPVTELLSSSDDRIVNERLGEELLAGGDYDDDGRPDLFVGDMTARALERSGAGVGFVIYDAAKLRSFSQITLLSPPEEVQISTIAGAFSGGIASDTVRHGDFDADGITDLAFGSPNASPKSRVQAGTLHVLWGSTRRWPELVDLAELPSARDVQVTVVEGAEGGFGADSGDMLAYSAEVADVDADGADDLVANEMGGNGIETGSEDVGNLLVLSGRLLARGRPDCHGLIDGTARVDDCGICGVPGQETSCVRFSTDVSPLLLEFCPSCHGAAGGLSVFTYDQLMSGTSEHGPVVIPGDPEASVLVQKLTASPPFGDRMPPPPEAELLPDDMELVEAWILGGARDN